MNDLRAKIDERLARPRSYRVLVRRCKTAEPDRVRAIVNESLADLGIRPRGRVLIKPNVVTANRKYIHDSFTDPKIVAEAIRWAREGGADEVTVGESSGFGVPSRLFLAEAGYFELARAGARVVDFNTEPTVTVPLRRAMHHQTMKVARSLAEADTMIWMPKLKYHIFCQVTCSLKLNIGILTHDERMLYHDDRVDEKVVDVLEMGYPDAIIVDAVTIGTGFESAPRPIPMGAILVADDPVAMDLVACRLLHHEPHQVVHLMQAMERGYGPRQIGDVRIEGDVEIDELRAATAGHESEYQDIQKLRTPIRFYSGVDPVRGRLCHGGCLGAVKGCLGTIDKRRPGSVAKAREGAIVTGVFKGDVDAGDGVAFLIGTCTRVEGTIRAKKIRRVGGCPIGAKQLMFTLPFYFKLPNPVFDLRDSILFVAYSIDKLVRRALGRFARKAAVTA